MSDDFVLCKLRNEKDELGVRIMQETNFNIALSLTAGGLDVMRQTVASNNGYKYEQLKRKETERGLCNELTAKVVGRDSK